MHDVFRLAAVLNSSAVTDSPLEVSLRVGLNEGVDGSNVSLSITSTTTGSGYVLVVTTNTHQLMRGYIP
jgi:predicted S18 family serine protease